MEEGWGQQWPLEAGRYKAFLARNAVGTPYPVIAESAVFRLTGAPSPTTLAPVAAPVPVTPAPVKPAPTTQQPTREPSLAPIVPAPQPDPTSIVTDKTIYFADEDIVVSFENDNPQVGDWIGIYPASQSSDELPDAGEMWMWHCGQRNRCARPVRHLIGRQYDKNRLEVLMLRLAFTTHV